MHWLPTVAQHACGAHGPDEQVLPGGNGVKSPGGHAPVMRLAVTQSPVVLLQQRGGWGHGLGLQPPPSVKAAPAPNERVQSSTVRMKHSPL